MSQSGRRIPSDGPIVSEGGVEIDMPDEYRLPSEAAHVLMRVILAVRERKLTPERGVA
ncbi:Uncharacterised protein [Mycobacteroides abscessus subsp. abscessus]|nr:Uncharacterised protein [Mycobacteroides abscessus subsp. abscessus]SHU41164.1 Uncharacterised protein [Mycobacteroides abscessus subsp. abscessus]SHU45281.1 Uncharacterised protein [Mycobacteroides abscessus subsp. abscessus]SHX88703.1 Uncharacterised protein [Mycobacteroides abscessus subsp. abscessus]SIA94392.1 Uncharacterised protein [Mycobacteroides abscessus subsp. abscessus]